jgi:hypothetical protein
MNFRNQPIKEQLLNEELKNADVTDHSIMLVGFFSSSAMSSFCKVTAENFYNLSKVVAKKNLI